jgi:hypothetical protein
MADLSGAKIRHMTKGIGFLVISRIDLSKITLISGQNP